MLEDVGELLDGGGLDGLPAAASTVIGPQKLDRMTLRDPLGLHGPLDDRAVGDHALGAGPRVRLGIDDEHVFTVVVEWTRPDERVVVTTELHAASLGETLYAHLAGESVDLILG